MRGDHGAFATNTIRQHLEFGVLGEAFFQTTMGGISGDRELPTIESEMHDSFGVSTLYTTSSIRCQAVEYAFPYFLRFDVELRKTT